MKRSPRLLLAMSILLIGSGALRLSGGIQIPAVLADEVETCVDTTPEVLAALNDRSDRLDQREDTLNTRAREIAEQEEALTAHIAEMEATKASLEDLLNLADNAVENDLARLTEVYQNMKPRDATALFTAMDPDFAAGFLARMRPDAAAAIMSGMSPETAYTISAVLAGRFTNLALDEALTRP